MKMFSTLLLVILATLCTRASTFSPSILKRGTGSIILGGGKTARPVGLWSRIDLTNEASQRVGVKEFDFPEGTVGLGTKAALGSVASIAILLSDVAPANAAGPDWGIFEGKTGSLLHPVSMACLLAFSLNTGFQGFKWRRQRTLGDDISALKKTLPAKPEEGEAPSSEFVRISKEIDELQTERKELSSQGNRDKHWQSGTTLAFVGTFFAIEGPLNTYARAGKLFPGPHLYAGAALVVLWSAAAACVPAMQKGNDGARSAHIALNAGATGLFFWQVVSGFPILQKVWEKTQWP